MLKIAPGLACFMVAAITSIGAQALPGLPVPTAQVVSPEVVPVRGFCGLGAHRGPYGNCVPNGYYGYAAPPVYVAPPIVVAPPLVVPPPRVVCPYGYYWYPAYGRCVPTP